MIIGSGGQSQAHCLFSKQIITLTFFHYQVIDADVQVTSKENSFYKMI